MKETIIKYREVFLILLFCVAVFLGMVFLVIPLWDQIAYKKNKLQEKIAEKEYQIAKIKEKPKMKEKFEKIVSQEGEIQELITKDNAVKLFEDLEKLASSTNNQISYTTQDEANDKLQAKKTPKSDKEKVIVDVLPSQNFLKMQIEVTGTYQSVYEFMKKMENFQYQNDVTGIQLQVTEVEKRNESRANENPFVPMVGADPDFASDKAGIMLVAKLTAVFYNQE